MLEHAVDDMNACYLLHFPSMSFHRAQTIWSI